MRNVKLPLCDRYRKRYSNEVYFPLLMLCKFSIKIANTSNKNKLQENYMDLRKKIFSEINIYLKEKKVIVNVIKCSKIQNYTIIYGFKIISFYPSLPYNHNLFFPYSEVHIISASPLLNGLIDIKLKGFFLTHNCTVSWVLFPSNQIVWDIMERTIQYSFMVEELRSWSITSRCM